jgi:hypothetical protein
MNLQIYQAYYKQEQLPHLDPVFIPYDNTDNPLPHLREYPMWQKLFHKHKDTDAYWGLMSWLWFTKTKTPAATFTQWMLDNPGYDVYHIDPFPELPHQFVNIWTQGNVWCPGMNDFCNRLFPKFGIETKVEEYQYTPEEFATCNYFVGNDKFWKNYMSFLDLCLKFIHEDEAMNDYIYKKGGMYNGHFVPNFPFVMERLFSLHNILNPNVTVKKYPL